VWLALRVVAACVFVALGQLKLFDSIDLGTAQVVLPRGPEGFAVYLDAIGVPFPLFHAWLVIGVELVCGLGLLLGAVLPMLRRHTHLFALPLAGDMLVATATVGLPNLLGDSVHIGGVAITAQPWRLPLEVGLLLINLGFLWRPVRARLARLGPTAGAG
jgi:uncharacterized membrane protein YphA (DoxX/SURF4 family)